VGASIETVEAWESKATIFKFQVPSSEFQVQCAAGAVDADCKYAFPASRFAQSAIRSEKSAMTSGFQSTQPAQSEIRNHKSEMSLAEPET